VGIVTNKFARFTEPVVNALALAERASTVVSGDTRRIRNHTRRRFCTQRRLEGLPSRCMYVGDDLRDIVAGNAAGRRSLRERGHTGEASDTWPATGWIADPLALLNWLPARGTR
jgi:phosphoglycolate phosphatase